MEILLNELSLSGQFGSIGDFIGRGLDPFLAVISEVNSSANTILKKQDFWQLQVTRSDTIHDIFIGKISRTNDSIRKSKSLLASLISEPFWEDSQKHIVSDSYDYNGKNIVGSSIAESCKRDKIVISFIHADFSTTKLKITKNSTQIIDIDNIFDKTHYIEVAYTCGQLEKCKYFERKFVLGLITLLENECRFTRTRKTAQGQQIYIEITTRHYWYLDNLHKKHYEVFDSRGIHIGEASLDGIINVSKKDNTKTITI
jgi:hypothetical protein